MRNYLDSLSQNANLKNIYLPLKNKKLLELAHKSGTRVLLINTIRN
jgi:hypothetical protein